MPTDTSSGSRAESQTTEDEVRGIINRARANESEDIDMYERLVLMLAARVDDIEENVDEAVERARRANTHGIRRANKRMDEVEKKVELLNAKKNLNIDVASELSVIELRLLQGHEFRRVNEQRAATLAIRWFDWATGGVSGSKLKATEAKKFLSMEEGIDLDPTLAHRAMEELEKQADGKFSLQKVRGEKVLQMPKNTIWCPTEEKLLKASGEDI